jgi:hypothetical protein
MTSWRRHFLTGAFTRAAVACLSCAVAATCPDNAGVAGVFPELEDGPARVQPLVQARDLSAEFALDQVRRLYLAQASDGVADRLGPYLRGNREALKGE